MFDQTPASRMFSAWAVQEGPLLRNPADRSSSEGRQAPRTHRHDTEEVQICFAALDPCEQLVVSSRFSQASARENLRPQMGPLIRDDRGHPPAYLSGPDRFAQDQPLVSQGQRLRRDSSKTSANGKAISQNSGEDGWVFPLGDGQDPHVEGQPLAAVYRPAAKSGRIGLGGFSRHDAHARHPHERDSRRSEAGGRPARAHSRCEPERLYARFSCPKEGSGGRSGVGGSRYVVLEHFGAGLEDR